MTDIDLTAAVEAVEALDWSHLEFGEMPSIEQILATALPLILAQVETTDERIGAWEAVASHEALKPSHDEERPLLPAVLDRLTNLADLEQAVNELAPAHIKPSRDGIARAMYESRPRNVRWDDQNPRYCDEFRRDADAVLALLNGKTEQEVRDEIAEEIAEVTRTIRNAQLDAHGFIPDTVGHVLAGYAQAEGVARGGEQDD